ncbi:4-hydroxythreonine-4-phosphate dehydrogenase PdxA [Flavobacterium orientale]|uniref:4-hydroxythreonine-4-phosphate dehydrogenase n=1 Tax=Flavobacterium orientale TaxID=1756020 RepID=A0A916XYG4_9FLAO|nr:4-hydroxythreonine-4-phosphate dehydrogenase PdxA [Flavobacterium orientale]GGD20843.1 4-hydroxythreonine-4-phosphate dehydrogenase [Flavobacterium orientale]
MNKAENILVGISIGDLNGIGSEVVLKTFEDPRMLEFCTPIIFANVKMLSFLRKSHESTAFLHGIDKLDQIVPGKINVYNLWKDSFNLEYGVANDVVGSYAIKSFVAATKALKEGVVDVLVTAPINKYNIQTEDFNFPGHTDYLNQELDGDALMLMVSDSLRIGLLTDHIPVTDVSKHITEKLIRQKISTIKQSLIQDFKIRKPKIAVLGLNPHCGDQGVIGKEDDAVLRPTIRKMFDEGTFVFGPYAADSFFGTNSHEKYDAVIACYHDQGLIPFKTLSFGNGVNYTAGLNKVRTSPDHGTAFEIAGKNQADHNSFKEAVYLAIDIYKSRFEYAQITEKPLKTKEKQF